MVKKYKLQALILMKVFIILFTFYGVCVFSDNIFTYSLNGAIICDCVHNLKFHPFVHKWEIVGHGS